MIKTKKKHQIKYYLRPLPKLFCTMTFCDWTTPSTRKNVPREKEHHCKNNSLLHSESKRGQKTNLS